MNEARPEKAFRKALEKIASYEVQTIVQARNIACSVLAHEAPKDEGAKTVPMEMLYGIHQLSPDNFEKAVVRYVGLCGYTVTESAKEELR